MSIMRRDENLMPLLIFWNWKVGVFTLLVLSFLYVSITFC